MNDRLCFRMLTNENRFSRTKVNFTLNLNVNDVLKYVRMCILVPVLRLDTPLGVVLISMINT